MRVERSATATCIACGGNSPDATGRAHEGTPTSVSAFESGNPVAGDSRPTVGGTGRSSSYGSRLDDIIAPRGLNLIYNDERTGDSTSEGSGIAFTLRYIVCVSHAGRGVDQVKITWAFSLRS